MKASKVITIAWKGLVKNKLRSLLTMLGVIIGVAAGLAGAIKVEGWSTTMLSRLPMKSTALPA